MIRFFLSYSDLLYLPTVGVEGYCCARSHSVIDTLCVTPLNEGSARCRELHLMAQNTLKRQTSMPLTGFEPAIPASERPQTDALDCAATRIGLIFEYQVIFRFSCMSWVTNAKYCAKKSGNQLVTL